MPGIGGLLPKKEKESSLFVIRPLNFSKAQGLSLLSLYVKSGSACQLTFFERQAFVFASTSSGLMLLIPPNNCGFFAVERVKLTPKYCYI